jgi:endonuclease YncB( thermonuclease family)
MKRLVKKTNKKSKKIIAGVVASAALVGSTGWFILKSPQGVLKVPTYEVLEVIDGDTFITREQRHIRLASVSAPELDLCGGQEAKEGLKDLIEGKPLYLKVLFNDDFGRLVSLVYTPDGMVNEQLLEKGLVYYGGSSNEPAGISKKAQVAKEKQLGIFGPNCTQETNKVNPKCVIKANNRLNSGGNKFYRFPGCRSYNYTSVQLYLGDSWFCSEKEAIKAGYTKGDDCIHAKFP